MVKQLMKFRIIFALALLFQLIAAPLHSFAQEANTTAPTGTSPIEYLALGDSLAFGIGSQGEIGSGYTDFLAQSMKSMNVLKSFNKGFSLPKHTTGDVLKDLQENVAKPIWVGGLPGEIVELHKSIAAADLITISVGANDALAHIKMDPATGAVNIDMVNLTAAIKGVGANYHSMLSKIYEINPDVQIYVMGYYNPFPHIAPEHQPQLGQLLVSLNGAIQAGMTGTNAIFVPTSEVIATDYSAYLPNPSNIHLSEAGYKLVAELFGNKMKEQYPIFSDIATNQFKEFIEKSVALGLIKGHLDGTFKPDDKLTRVQAAAIIVRALNLKSDVAAPFTDIVNYSEVTQAEIAAAYKFGIVKGNNGKFNPSEPITRAQLALMLNRTYVFVTGKPYIETEVAPFTDIGNNDAETKNAISMLYDLRIVDGSNGKYMPNDATTRGQAAKIFVNFVSLAQ